MTFPLKIKQRRGWEDEENSMAGELRSFPIKKWVCRYCKKEFGCGRGLGGHIKVHFQDRRNINFTRKKKSKRRTHPESSYAAPPRHRRNITNYREKGKSKRNGACDEIVDLSKSLSGFGWKGHRKRQCIEPAPKVMIITIADFDDSDDDGDSFVVERLRRSGFYSSAHRIACTRSYMCNTCNVVLPTYHDVLCHANDSCSSLNSAGDDDNGRVVVVAEGEYNGDNEENEMGEGQDKGDGDDEKEKKKEDEEGGEEEEDEEEEEKREGEEEDKEGYGEDEKRAEEEKDEEEKEEVDEVVDEEPQKLEGAETPSIGDDEVAGVEEGENGARASTKADKVANQEEGVCVKSCTQVYEASDNKGSSMDQMVSTSDPPKLLDFDLNEMPPEEEY